MGMLGYSTGSSVVMRRYTVSRMGIVIVSGSFPGYLPGVLWEFKWLRSHLRYHPSILTWDPMRNDCSSRVLHFRYSKTTLVQCCLEDPE